MRCSHEVVGTVIINGMGGYFDMESLIFFFDFFVESFGN